MKTSDVLAEVRRLLADEAAWLSTHGDLSPYHWAQDASGGWVRPDHPRAVRWTLPAAVVRAGGHLPSSDPIPVVSLDQHPHDRRHRASHPATHALQAALHVRGDLRGLREWNDQATHADVLALIDEAMGLGREDVQRIALSVRAPTPPQAPERHEPAPHGLVNADGASRLG
jgi:hypothetical protein